jgi:hypothetical protein
MVENKTKGGAKSKGFSVMINAEDVRAGRDAPFISTVVQLMQPLRIALDCEERVTIVLYGGDVEHSELRRFLIKLDHRWPFWAHFLSPPSLVWVARVMCERDTPKQTDLAVEGWLGAQLVALREFYDSLSLPASTATRRMEVVRKILSDAGLAPPIH